MFGARAQEQRIFKCGISGNDWNSLFASDSPLLINIAPSLIPSPRNCHKTEISDLLAFTLMLKGCITWLDAFRLKISRFSKKWRTCALIYVRCLGMPVFDTLPHAIQIDRKFQLHFPPPKKKQMNYAQNVTMNCHLGFQSWGSRAGRADSSWTVGWVTLKQSGNLGELHMPTLHK